MRPAERSVLREGVVAGLIGAAVVAVWFLVFDTLRGQPFLTPGLLGAFVFYGVNTPIGLTPAFWPILGYTVLHGLAFVAFGVMAAAILAVSEREPTLFVAFVILFACFEVFFFGVLGALGQSIAGALVWWAVLIGNLLASVAMLGYLFRTHRALPGTLVGTWGTVLRWNSIWADDSAMFGGFTTCPSVSLLNALASRTRPSLATRPRPAAASSATVR